MNWFSIFRLTLKALCGSLLFSLFVSGCIEGKPQNVDETGKITLSANCRLNWHPQVDFTKRYVYGSLKNDNLDLQPIYETRIKSVNDVGGITVVRILTRFLVNDDMVISETREVSDFILDTTYWNYEMPDATTPRQKVRSVDGLKAGILPNIKLSQTVKLKLLNIAYHNGQAVPEVKELKTSIKLLGCGHMDIAGRTHDIRIYDLRYPIYTFGQDGKEDIKPFHQQIILDEKTGIELKKTIFDQDGQASSKTVLLREEPV